MSAEREGLRERIARKLHEIDLRQGNATAAWDDMPYPHQCSYRNDAEAVFALLGERAEPVLYTRREFIEAIRESKKAGNRALFTNYLWLNPTEEDIQRRDMVPLYSEPVGRAQKSEREDDVPECCSRYAMGEEHGDAVVLEVLCRVFDDWEPIWAEWLESGRHGFLWWGRALGAHIRKHLRASEPTGAETRTYRSPQIINVADALRAAESREGEEPR